MTGFKHGLYKARTLCCPCGASFTARSPQATYCSNVCRMRYTGYGRHYGQYEPRPLGVTRS